MLGLGPHADFVVAAYAVTFVGIAALILATVGDDLKQRRRLSKLERQGIKRRSDPKRRSDQKTPVAKKPAPKTRTRAAKPSASKKPPASKAATGKPAPERPRARKTPA